MKTLIIIFFSILKKYAARLQQKPKIHIEQEHIKMPADDNARCECARKPIKTTNEKKLNMEKENMQTEKVCIFSSSKFYNGSKSAEIKIP